MIIKFLSRKSNSGQLMQYICRYIFHDEKLQKSDLMLTGTNGRQDRFLIRHNVRARSIKGFVREFNENESYRLVHRKDSVKVFHTIISFSPKDRALISDKILKDIAEKFIKERGINNLYIGTKHEDKDHIHLHICSSGTQLNGRSARVSNQKFRSIKHSLERYQREAYPFLSNSQVEHSRKQRLSKETLLTTLKANRQTDKARLVEALEKMYSQSQSKVEFLAHIESSGHQTYLRNGKLQGILYEGKVKYRLSRLGFDQERFDVLDRSQGRTSELKKLASIRKGIHKEVSQEVQPKPETTPPANSVELSKLDELAAIRNKTKENEFEKEDDYQKIRDFGERPELPMEENDGTDDDPVFLPTPIQKQLSARNETHETK